ncbi:acetoacetate decarboxylase, partial [Acinetobacter baumannii]
MTQHFSEVVFGHQKIQLPTGGYYDRFRMYPDLDKVAQDPAAGNIDFFRHIPNKLVESRVGPVWAPNFYYRSANVQLLMLAPIKQI